MTQGASSSDPQILQILKFFKILTSSNPQILKFQQPLLHTNH